MAYYTFELFFDVFIFRFNRAPILFVFIFIYMCFAKMPFENCSQYPVSTVLVWHVLLVAGIIILSNYKCGITPLFHIQFVFKRLWNYHRKDNLYNCNLFNQCIFISTC